MRRISQNLIGKGFAQLCQHPPISPFHEDMLRELADVEARQWAAKPYRTSTLSATKTHY
jgi:hypothetical protein